MPQINEKIPVFTEYNNQFKQANESIFYYTQVTRQQFDYIWSDFCGNKIDEKTYRKKMENVLRAFSKELEAAALRLQPIEEKEVKHDARSINLDKV